MRSAAADVRTRSQEARDELAAKVLHPVYGLRYYQELRANTAVLSPGLKARGVGRHQVIVGRAITDALAGRGPRRLIVVMPPQVGKTWGAEGAVGHLAITRPELRSTWVSYALPHARRSTTVIRRDVKRRGMLNGVTLLPDMDRMDEFGFAQHGQPTGGRVLAVGGNGGITGTSADVLVIDDPVKNRVQASSPIFRRRVWEAWEDDWSTRVQENGIVVVQQTRWDPDDLAGRLITGFGVEEEDRAKAEGWHVIHIPALADPERFGPDPLGRAPGESIWPNKFTAEAYERVRASRGSRTWNALYQGDPRDPEGVGEFHASELAKATQPLPATEDLSGVIAFVDPAYSDRDGADQTGIVLVRLGASGRLYMIADLSQRVHVKRVDWGRLQAEASSLRLRSVMGSEVPPAPIVRVVVETDRDAGATEEWVRDGMRAHGLQARFEGVKAKGYGPKPLRHSVLAGWIAVEQFVLVADAPGLSLWKDQALTWYEGQTVAGNKVSPDRLDAAAHAALWQGARLAARRKDAAGGAMVMPGE